MKHARHGEIFSHSNKSFSLQRVLSYVTSFWRTNKRTVPDVALQPNHVDHSHARSTFIPRLNDISPILFLFFLVFLIAVTNYTPGTYLSGWDNLHPEFDFGMNIRRSLFSVWQEYQGLGLLGGMGHAAALPQQLFVWLISFVVPQSLNRYVFHFLMLFAGAWGVYTLVGSFIFGNRKNSERKLLALCSGVFYLLNLATVQMFNAPFEPYSVHFGLLPWLFWANLHFVTKGSARAALLLVVINVLAVPQGYIGTFFLVYVISLVLVMVQYSYRFIYLRRIVTALLILFMVNAFWLLPNLYFIITKVHVNVEAKINQMTTRDMFLRNQKYGDLANVTLFRGFWFDNIEADTDGVLRYQMHDWIEYMKSPLVPVLGYGLFAFCVVGIVWVLLRRNRSGILFVPVAVLAFTILANDTPPFSSIVELLYRLPLASQVFRFPFTKWSIMSVFSLSIFFACGVDAVSRLHRSRLFTLSVFVVFLLAPIVYCWPVFSGKLLYFKEAAAIPKEYFDTFDFFRKQPASQRIANFPQFTYLGWGFYRWNYSGSGFLWYGIESPIVDRAFDVWSRENENYYHELSYALYSGRTELFLQVLKKYDIQWVLVDKNIISPFSARSVHTDKLGSMIASQPAIHPAAVFGNIEIYRVGLLPQADSFVLLGENLPTAGPPYQWNDNDQAFYDLGHYLSVVGNQSLAVSDQEKGRSATNDQRPTTNDYSYPFRSLFTGRLASEHQFTVEEKIDRIVLKTTIPNTYSGAKLLMPAINIGDVTEIHPQDYAQQVVRLPQVFFNRKPLILSRYTVLRNPQDHSTMQEITLPEFDSGVLEIELPYIAGINSFHSGDWETNRQVEPKRCQTTQGGAFRFQRFSESGHWAVRLISQDAKGCWDISVPYISQRSGYLIRTVTRALYGKPLVFWLENLNRKKADIETMMEKNNQWHTEYFLQPPMEEYAVGYGIHFANESIGSEESINDIQEVAMYPIPYQFLKSMVVVPAGSTAPLKGSVTTEGITVDHPNTSYYQVTISPQPRPKADRPLAETTNTLILSQSYDAGWKAYPVSCLPREALRSEASGSKTSAKWGELSVVGCRLKMLLPFVFFSENKNHVLVNNWSNGWTLSKQLADSSKPTTEKELQAADLLPQTIVLIYLPQYLQYLGFGLLVMALISLLFLKRTVKSGNR